MSARHFETESSFGQAEMCNPYVEMIRATTWEGVYGVGDDSSRKHEQSKQWSGSMMMCVLLSTKFLFVVLLEKGGNNVCRRFSRLLETLLSNQTIPFWSVWN